MSIEARYSEGVFRPLQDVNADPSKVYRVFSDEEIRTLAEDLTWLKASEASFSFWNNDEDALYDRL